MRRRYIVAATFYVFVLRALALQAQSTPREPVGSLETTKVFREYERGGIPAAAAVFGIYRSQASFGGNGITEDVTGLTWASHVVILGTVQSAQPVLTHDQRSINTEFRVRAKRVFKGAEAIQQDRDIVVNVPGGQLRFPNGTSAEVSLVTGPSPMRAGRRYLLFLELIEKPELDSIAGRLGTFRPTGGPEGIYELTGTPLRIVPYVKELPVSQELLALGSIDRAFQRLESAVLAAPSFPGEKRVEARPQ